MILPSILYWRQIIWIVQKFFEVLTFKDENNSMIKRCPGGNSATTGIAMNWSQRIFLINMTVTQRECYIRFATIHLAYI